MNRNTEWLTKVFVQLVKLANTPWSLFARQFTEGDKSLPSDPVVSSEEGGRCVSAAQREVPFHRSADGRNPPRLATCSGGRACTSGVHVSGMAGHAFFLRKKNKKQTVHVFTVDWFISTSYNM